MKAYSAKSSAVRAAKAQFGAEWETKAAIMLAADSKGFCIIEKAPAKAPQAAPEAKADGHMSLAQALAESGETLADLKDEEVIAGLSHCPSCECHLSNGVGHHMQDVNGSPIKHEAFQYACLGCGHEFGPAIKAKRAPSAPTAAADRTDWKLSTAIKPTKLVHIIASEMPEASRKEVIEACIKAGIGAGTARTQYQAYYSARKADEARSAK